MTYWIDPNSSLSAISDGWLQKDKAPRPHSLVINQAIESGKTNAEELGASGLSIIKRLIEISSKEPLTDKQRENCISYANLMIDISREFVFSLVHDLEYRDAMLALKEYAEKNISNQIEAKTIAQSCLTRANVFGNEYFRLKVRCAARRYLLITNPNDLRLSLFYNGKDEEYTSVVRENLLDNPMHARLNGEARKNKLASKITPEDAEAIIRHYSKKHDLNFGYLYFEKQDLTYSLLLHEMQWNNVYRTQGVHEALLTAYDDPNTDDTKRSLINEALKKDLQFISNSITLGQWKLQKPNVDTAQAIDLKPLISYCKMTDNTQAAKKLATYAQALLPVRGIDGDLALLMALSANKSQDEKLAQEAETIIISHMNTGSPHLPLLAKAYAHIATSETLAFTTPMICEAYRNIPDTYAETNEFDREGCGHVIYVHEPNKIRDDYEDALKRLTKKYANVIDEPTINHIMNRLKLGAQKLDDRDQIDPTSMLGICCNVFEHPETCMHPELKRDFLGMMKHSAENTLNFTFYVDFRPPVVKRVETLLYGRPIRRNQLDPI